MDLTDVGEYRKHNDKFAIKKKPTAKRGVISVKEKYPEKFRSLKFLIAESPLDVEVYAIESSAFDEAMTLLSTGCHELLWFDMVFYPLQNPKEILVPTGSIFVKFKDDTKAHETKELLDLLGLEKEDFSDYFDRILRLRLTERSQYCPSMIVTRLLDSSLVLMASLDVYRPTMRYNESSQAFFNRKVVSKTIKRWRKSASRLTIFSYCLGTGIFGAVGGGMYMFKIADKFVKTDFSTDLKQIQTTSHTIQKILGERERKVENITGKLVNLPDNDSQTKILNSLSNRAKELDVPFKREGYILEIVEKEKEIISKNKFPEKLSQWISNSDVVVGDIDGDGDTDLVKAAYAYDYDDEGNYSYDTEIEVVLAEGDANFTDLKPLDLEPIDLLENFEVYRDSIKIIDVNGDNKLDLVLLGSSDGSDKEAKLADSDKKDKPVDSNRKDTLAVLYNQGNLNFKGEKIKIPMVDKPFRLSILDINSDDIQDMIFSKILGNKLLILISNISSDSGYEYKYSEIIMPTEILDVGITDINDKHKNNEFFVVNAHGISELKFENKKFSLASKLLFKTSPQEKIKQLHIISTPSTKDKVQKTLLAFDSNGDIQSLNIVMPIPDESEIESEIKITSKKFKKTSKTSILSSSDYEAFRDLRFADVNKDGFDDIISILGNKLYVALSGKDKDFELFLNKPIELTMDGLNRNIRIGNFIKKEDNSAKDYLEILTIGELLRPLKAVEKVEDDIKKAFFKESENLKTAAKELMIGEDYFGLVERLGKTLETLIIDLEDVKAKKEIVYKNEEKSDQDIQAAHNIAVYKGITLGSYRFGVLAITVFLVQIIVVSYRYSVKMAAFYNSRADALVAYPHFMYHF